MVSARLIQKQGSLFAFEISDGQQSCLAHVSNDMHIHIDENCKYKDLAMRAVINKLKNSHKGRAVCGAVDGLDLESFGFTRRQDTFFADIEKLTLGCCGSCCEGEKCD